MSPDKEQIGRDRAYR